VSTYSINYDLSNPGRDYSRLITAIHGLGPWCHPVESSWLVNTNLSAIQIRDHLRANMDANDKLIVFAVAEERAWINMRPEVYQWLTSSWQSACAVS
jgi:hypothetical protein